MKAEYGCVAIAIIFAIIVTILFVIFTESCITPFFLGINDVTYRMIQFRHFFAKLKMKDCVRYD